MQGVSWRVTQKPLARLLSPDAPAKDFANLARGEYKAGLVRAPFRPFHQLRAICLCFPVEQQTLTFEWRLEFYVGTIYIYSLTVRHIQDECTA